jgi:hypothetical protein
MLTALHPVYVCSTQELENAKAVRLKGEGFRPGDWKTSVALLAFFALPPVGRDIPSTIRPLFELILLPLG